MPAGKVYGTTVTKYTSISQRLIPTHTTYLFASEIDWEIAKWAKEMKMGDNSLTRLLAILVVSGLTCAFGTNSNRATIGCEGPRPDIQGCLFAQPNLRPQATCWNPAA